MELIKQRSESGDYTDLKKRKLSFGVFENDAWELELVEKNSAFFQSSKSPLLRSIYFQNEE